MAWPAVDPPRPAADHRHRSQAPPHHRWACPDAVCPCRHAPYGYQWAVCRQRLDCQTAAVDADADACSTARDAQLCCASLPEQFLPLPAVYVPLPWVRHRCPIVRHGCVHCLPPFRVHRVASARSPCVHCLAADAAFVHCQAPATAAVLSDHCWCCCCSSAVAPDHHVAPDCVPRRASPARGIKDKKVFRERATLH